MIFYRGATPNDNTGDNLREVGLKLNRMHAVLSASTAAQPGSPSEGDFYIVPNSATGADWSGQDGSLAWYGDGGWEFYPPTEGFAVWVSDEDVRYRFDGTAWTEEAAGSGGGSGGSASEFRGFFAVRGTSSQSIPNTTQTRVVFNSEEFDTEDAYDPTTGEYTVPADLDGKYLMVTAGIQLGPGEVRDINLYVQVNDQDLARQNVQTSRAINIAAGPILVSAGDVISIKTYSYNGSTSVVNGPHSFFGAHVIEAGAVTDSGDSFTGFFANSDGGSAIPGSANVLEAAKPNNVFYDTESAYDTATGKFTVPASLAGSYMVFTGQIHFVDAEAGALAQIRVIRGGVDYDLSNTVYYDAVRVPAQTPPFLMAEGDEVVLQARASSSFGIDATLHTWFSGYVVAGASGSGASGGGSGEAVGFGDDTINVMDYSVVDDGTDQGVELQAAADLGKHLYIPPGRVFVVNTTFTLSTAGQRVFGGGTLRRTGLGTSDGDQDRPTIMRIVAGGDDVEVVGITFEHTGGDDAYAITAEAVSNPHVHDCRFFDLQPLFVWKNTDGAVFESNYSRGAAPTGVATGGDATGNVDGPVTNTSIKNNVFIEPAEEAVDINWDTHGGEVSGNTVFGSGEGTNELLDFGATGSGKCTGFKVSDNYLNGQGVGAAAVRLYSETEDIHFSGNFYTGFTANKVIWINDLGTGDHRDIVFDGETVVLEGAGDFNCFEFHYGNRVTVRNTRIKGAGRHGIETESTFQGTIVLEDNDVQATGDGIHLYGGRAEIRRNRVHDCGDEGIYLESFIDDGPIVEDNDVHDNSLGTSGNYGIEIEAGIDGGYLKGNHVYNTGGSPTQKGITFQGACDGWTVTGNEVRDSHGGDDWTGLGSLTGSEVVTTPVLTKAEAETLYQPLGAGSEPYVILAIGQSNMRGVAGQDGGDGSVNDRVFFWNSQVAPRSVGTAFEVGELGQDPFTGGTPVPNNLAFQVAKGLQEETGRDVYGILVSAGGHSIEAFMADADLTANGWTKPGGDTDLYDVMVTELDAALAALPGPPTLDCVIVHQGEANELEQVETYALKLKVVLERLVTDGYAVRGKTQFIAGELHDAPLRHVRHSSALKRLQYGIDFVPQFKVVPSANLQSIDGTHFTGEDIDVFAARFVDARTSLPTPHLVDITGQDLSPETGLGWACTFDTAQDGAIAGVRPPIPLVDTPVDIENNANLGWCYYAPASTTVQLATRAFWMVRNQTEFFVDLELSNGHPSAAGNFRVSAIEYDLNRAYMGISNGGGATDFEITSGSNNARRTASFGRLAGPLVQFSSSSVRFFSLLFEVNPDGTGAGLRFNIAGMGWR